MGVLSLFNFANLLTLLNLLSGCMALVFLFNYQVQWVPVCILVSLVADFLDGFAARLTKNPTDIGKQLDSLADVVSFGVLPGAILFHLMFQKYETSELVFPLNRMYAYSIPAFLVTLAAALRLAKFNIDTRQSEDFLGLATPAATMFVLGLLLIVLYNPYCLAAQVFTGKVLYGTALLLSVLMIVEIPMFGFKFKSFGWIGNEIRYLFIILSVALLAVLKFAAVTLIIILYILISIATKLIKR